MSGGGDVDGWHQYLVDDVDNPVGGLNVRKGDRGGTNRHRSGAAHAELDVVSVEHRGHHAVFHVARSNLAGQDVMRQNIGERRHFFWRVKVVEIDASIGEGLVGRCKDRERPRALEGCYQVCLRQRCDEGIVDARAGCVGWNVLGGIRRGVEREGSSREEGNH